MEPCLFPTTTKALVRFRFPFARVTETFFTYNRKKKLNRKELFDSHKKNLNANSNGIIYNNNDIFAGV